MNTVARQLEREVRRLGRQRMECDERERVAMGELRRRARASAPMAQIKGIARDVARVRATRGKIYDAQDKVEGLRAKVVNGGVAVNVQSVLRQCTEVLASVPAVSDPRRARADLVAFSKAQAGMEIFEESVDDALGDVDADEEGDTLLEQILAEAGIGTATSLPSVPRPASAAEDAEVDDLIARLERLRQ